MTLRPVAPRFLGLCALVSALASGCREKQPPQARSASIATGAPLVVTMPSGRTDVFVLGSDGNVWQSTCLKDCTKQSSFGSFSQGPGRPPGGATSDPGGVAWSENRIDLFIRGSIANLWHQTWLNGRWLGWEDLSGGLQSFPIAASWASGRLDVFALCGDNRLWHRYCQAGDVQPTCRGLTWSNWLPDPGGPAVPATSSGSVVSSTSGRIELALRGNDGTLWFQRWENSYWIGWRSLGGELGTSPTLVASGGRTEAYVVDKYGKLTRAFVDSLDAPLAWIPANVEFRGEPRAGAPVGSNRTVVISKPNDSYAFQGVTCVPGAECAPLN